MPAKVVLKFFMVSSPSAGWPTAFCNNEASRSITIWGLWNTHELKLKNWTQEALIFWVSLFYRIFASGTNYLVFNGCLTSVTSSLVTVFNSSALHWVRRVVRGWSSISSRSSRSWTSSISSSSYLAPPQTCPPHRRDLCPHSWDRPSPPSQSSDHRLVN